MNECEFYKAERGRTECWRVAARVTKYGISGINLLKFVRRTGCCGNKQNCEFKKQYK